MTLHDAIAMVLSEHNTQLHPDNVAAEVNRRKLYTRRDGLPVKKNQIQARVSNHREMFTRENGLIGLADGDNVTPTEK
jgi:hypothetical protein